MAWMGRDRTANCIISDVLAPNADSCVDTLWLAVESSRRKCKLHPACCWQWCHVKLYCMQKQHWPGNQESAMPCLGSTEFSENIRRTRYAESLLSSSFLVLHCAWGIKRLCTPNEWLANALSSEWRWREAPKTQGSLQKQHWLEKWAKSNDSTGSTELTLAFQACVGRKAKTPRPLFFENL